MPCLLVRKVTKPEAVGNKSQATLHFLSCVRTINDSDACASVVRFFCYKLPRSPTTMRKTVSRPSQNFSFNCCTVDKQIKRTNLSVRQKLELIRKLESGVSVGDTPSPQLVPIIEDVL
jgi:hypothetical protein